MPPGLGKLFLFKTCQIQPVSNILMDFVDQLQNYSNSDFSRYLLGLPQSNYSHMGFSLILSGVGPLTLALFTSMATY